MKTSYTTQMADSTNEPVLQVNPVENNISLSATQPEKTYLKLRRTVLILTIVLIVVVIIALLYLNGKSLYDNGL